MKNSKNKRTMSLVKVIAFSIKTNLRIQPAVFIFVGAATFLMSAAMVFQVLVIQNLFDSAGGAITGGDISPGRVYFLAGILGALLISRILLNEVLGYMNNVMDTRAKGEISEIIHKKIGRLDPICFENVDMHDDLDKASEGAGTVITMTEIMKQLFLYDIPYLTFMSFYMYNLKPMFVVAMLFIFVPLIFSQFIRTGITAKFEDTAAPVRREYNYLSRTITDKEYFKETRILGAYPFFLKRFALSLKKLGGAEWKMRKRINFYEIFLNLFQRIGFIAILYIFVDALVTGDISGGAFAAVFNAINTMFGMMYGMVVWQIGGMTDRLGKAHNFIRFMEFPERGGNESSPDFNRSITAENVSFIYPGATHKSVDDVSVEIKAGETVAIVGENGAGKSTLVRLLIGLYMPSEGKVMLNGMNTADINSGSLFDGVSGIFQKYQRYKMTLEENIKISDYENGGEINDSANQAGVDYESQSFPDGTATMLSRDFDGVDLSGGQWQRVAIARGLYRRHNVIVLDEPTAAIDPLEESRIYNKFVEISKGKTAVIVTHRLGSAKIADRIIVMDKGKIAGAGTHQDLMRNCAVYADLYNSQADWYKE